MNTLRNTLLSAAALAAGTASASLCREEAKVSECLLLKNADAILTKMAVERDCITDVHAFHDHEAQGVAERVALIGMPSEEVGRTLLVMLGDSHNLTQAVLDIIEESKRDRTASRARFTSRA